MAESARLHGEASFRCLITQGVLWNLNRHGPSEPAAIAKSFLSVVDGRPTLESSGLRNPLGEGFTPRSQVIAASPFRTAKQVALSVESGAVRASSMSPVSGGEVVGVSSCTQTPSIARRAHKARLRLATRELGRADAEQLNRHRKHLHPEVRQGLRRRASSTDVSRRELLFSGRVQFSKCAKIFTKRDKSSDSVSSGCDLIFPPLS